MTYPLTRSRRLLYRWAGWFFFINFLCSLLIGINYVRLLPDFASVIGAATTGIVLGWVFFIISLVVQLAILFFIACVIILGVITILARRWLIYFLSAALATILITGLVIDSMAFALYQMHYAAVGFNIIKVGALSQVIPLSGPEKLFLMGIVVALLIVEYLIAFAVWRSVVKGKSRGHGYRWAVFFSALLIISYGSMYVATATGTRYWLSPKDNHVILAAARVIPYYNEVYEFLMPGNSEVRHVVTPAGDIPLQTRMGNKKLHYPLHPLQCAKPRKLLNIVIIGIDTWRYDTMNRRVTPHINQFAQDTLQFQEHWSGGNCTKPGVFSLFYALPPNYWRAFLHQQQGPVLIQQLLQDHYQLGIFSSAPLNFPEFNKTVFRDVPDLIVRIHGLSSVDRDRMITKEFKQFLVHRDQGRPFFSFLFYDAAHNYCEATTLHQEPFHPAVKNCERFSLTPTSDPIPYINRYHNALRFIDGEVNKILQLLQQRGLLQDTIVILTGDHGEQFNEEGMNYWDHASTYTPYQLHVPLLVYWPGKTAQQYTYLTTHYDIVPTLMTEVLGCSNVLADYSVGESLFTQGERPYFIAGSYADYAVVTAEKAIRIYSGGDYVVNDPRGHPVADGTLDVVPLRQAYEELNRYFQPGNNGNRGKE